MKIAIAGFGIEGQQSLEYYRHQGGHEITVLDEREQITSVPAGVDVRVGKGAYEDLAAYDIVIRTAGLPPAKLQSARKVWSATNEFFSRCPAPIIGVTGTKGKGTTSSLIASMLRAAGKTVHLVGNIGVPALGVLPTIRKNDIVVYEMSSFQLWDSYKSPHVAVVLMIELDHQDVHTDFDEYVAAKANITRFQSPDDVCIYNGLNPEATYIGTRCATGKSQAYLGEGAVVGRRQDSDGQEYFYYHDQRICQTSALTLPGPHNLDNAAAAIAAVFAVEEISPEAVARGLRDFKGLDHRLKYVATKNGVAYYDDSIATTPGSAIAALAAFDAPKVLILGGSSKGADFGLLATRIANSAVRHVILIGEEASVIASHLTKRAPNTTYTVLASPTMAQVVATAHTRAEPGDVVILSPACASFGLFKNYKDRGEQFIRAVRALED